MTVFASLAGPAAHQILELLAYFIGGRLYWRAAAQQARPAAAVDRLLLLAFTVFGAFAGSKLLHVAEHLPTLVERGDLALWVSGKSVLGGFIGGTLGAELGKKLIGWKASTGDAWVLALAAGLAIGRIGCQFSGPGDQTYGIPTNLPWGWDYGDGVLRHPAALYETVLVPLLAFLALRPALSKHRGAPFAAFLLGYCLLRFALEFLKPPFGLAIGETLPVALYAGLSAIQWAALAGALGYAALLKHRLHS